MSFVLSFKSAGLAIFEVFLLGACGFFVMKRKIISSEGLDALSRLVIELTLPAMVFSRMVRGFDFGLYPNWWFFPLLSVILTVVGLALGYILLAFSRGLIEKREFLSSVAFQNSGYLPLILAAMILPLKEAEEFYIYIFLFLLGFNLIIWSWGVEFLSYRKRRKFELGSLFSPAVIAIIVSFFFTSVGLNKFIPEAIITPLKMVGDCTVPLGIIVVGGSLAEAELVRGINKEAVTKIILAKLVILPLLALIFLSLVGLPKLVALLILLEAAMPPATSLSIIARHYGAEKHFISQAIFIGHIVSLVTIPIFLGLFGLIWP
jgi:predicted permease